MTGGQEVASSNLAAPTSLRTKPRADDTRGFLRFCERVNVLLPTMGGANLLGRQLSRTRITCAPWAATHHAAKGSAALEGQTIPDGRAEYPISPGAGHTAPQGQITDRAPVPMPDTYRRSRGGVHGARQNRTPSTAKGPSFLLQRHQKSEISSGDGALRQR
jgi:hypothetical protein